MMHFQYWWTSHLLEERGVAETLSGSSGLSTVSSKDRRWGVLFTALGEAVFNLLCGWGYWWNGEVRNTVRGTRGVAQRLVGEMKLPELLSFALLLGLLSPQTPTGHCHTWGIQTRLAIKMRQTPPLGRDCCRIASWNITDVIHENGEIWRGQVPLAFLGLHQPGPWVPTVLPWCEYTKGAFPLHS